MAIIVKMLLAAAVLITGLGAADFLVNPWQPPPTSFAEKDTHPAATGAKDDALAFLDTLGVAH
jgi:hypothetical protein